MKVLKLINDELLEEEIESITLKYMQSVVGGYIEAPYICDELSNSNIDVIINEEGKILDLPVTILLTKDYDEVIDTIQGNVLFCSHDEEGENIGLTNDQIQVIHNLFINESGLEGYRVDKATGKEVVIRTIEVGD